MSTKNIGAALHGRLDSYRVGLRRTNAHALGYHSHEDAPHHEAMGAKYNTHDRNNRSSYYVLVNRFLSTHIGHSWSRLYSEICAKTKKKSERQLREAFLNNVELNTFLQDGVVYYYCNYTHGGNGHERPILSGAYSGFYLCPTTQTLQYMAPVSKEKRKAQYEAKRAEILRQGPKNSNLVYHKIKGIWYEVKLAPLPKNAGYYTDVITGGLTDVGSLYHTHGVKGVYGVSRRQLNSKDLRKLGVTNAPLHPNS